VASWSRSPRFGSRPRDGTLSRKAEGQLASRRNAAHIGVKLTRISVREKGVTDPNEFDEFRRHREREERLRRILVRVLDVVTVLALAAIVVVVLNMFLY
jgi:hypothetical protein